MPRRKRSISVTFALCGLLNVLTIFGVSSGELKADAPVVLAAVATTATPINTQSIADVNVVVMHPGVRDYYSVGVAVRQRIAESAQRKQCYQRCLAPYQDCMRRGKSNAQCNQVIRSCRSACPQ